MQPGRPEQDTGVLSADCELLSFRSEVTDTLMVTEDYICCNGLNRLSLEHFLEEVG